MPSVSLRLYVVDPERGSGQQTEILVDRDHFDALTPEQVSARFVVPVTIAVVQRFKALKGGE